MHNRHLHRRNGALLPRYAAEPNATPKRRDLLTALATTRSLSIATHRAMLVPNGDVAEHSLGRHVMIRDKRRTTLGDETPKAPYNQYARPT